jgi:hypothetical protein
LRYLIAMVGAIAVAFAAMMLVSSGIADWYVDHRTFEDSDTVADMHALVFMAANAVALLVGWGIGWAIGGLIVKPEKAI